MKSLLALLALAAPAFADEVVLRNGSTFSGVVTRANGRVVVRMDFGTMSFAAVDVAAIRASDSPLQVLERQVGAATSAQDWHDAAAYAAANGLTSRVEELHGRAVDVDPEHAASRAALGYRKLDGRWLRGDDLMGALGFVRHGDAWVTPAERARLEAEAAAAREREEAVERLLAEERARTAAAAERRESRRYLDYERQVLERERQDVRRERVERSFRENPNYYRFCGNGYHRPSCGCHGVTTTRGGPGLSVSR